MYFAIAIYRSPEDAAAKAALSFSRELLAQGHSLYRLFFFSDGVLNGVPNHNPLFSDWQNLISEHQVDALLCVTSAKKRGIVEAASATGSSSALVPGAGFVIGGLGQLIDAAVHADRIVTFS